MISRLRRSVLFVPGDSTRMLRKAGTIPADVLLLNLEDGVAFSRKEEARNNVADALRSVDYGEREVVVRINSLKTETGVRDLAAIAPLRPDGICLPKTESAGDVRAADAALLGLETGHGLPGGSIRLHAMIESASGILHAAETASASARMASLIFGSADYVQDTRCHPGADRAELLFALQMMVAAARSGGIDAVDAPCFNLLNPELLRQEALQARRLGYDGKSALHPDQIPVIHEAFEATQDEVEWAKKVLAELDTAENRGRALSTLEGHLIDNPHRTAAERILFRRRSHGSDTCRREKGK